MKPPGYVVITPVRNEERYLPATIDSMVAQSIRPLQWILVDDGSTDATPALVESARKQHAWITLVRRRDRGYRLPGGGVVEAFYDGFEKLEPSEWDYLAKLDGDLSFEPRYFEECFRRFALTPKLGMAGGLICAQREGKLQMDYEGDPPFHVRGATKIYRRKCWEQLAPLVRAPGWDTIDELKANANGWLTWTFDDLRLVQHKPTGSADGRWRNWFKNGRANYVTGYHPLFMFAKCVSRFTKRPFGFAALGLWAGFVTGYVSPMRQVDDPAMIRFLRREQLNRLLGRASIWTDYPQPVR